MPTVALPGQAGLGCAPMCPVGALQGTGSGRGPPLLVQMWAWPVVSGTHTQMLVTVTRGRSLVCRLETRVRFESRAVCRRDPSSSRGQALVYEGRHRPDEARPRGHAASRRAGWFQCSLL